MPSTKFNFLSTLSTSLIYCKYPVPSLIFCKYLVPSLIFCIYPVPSLIFCQFLGPNFIFCWFLWPSLIFYQFPRPSLIISQIPRPILIFYQIPRPRLIFSFMSKRATSNPHLFTMSCLSLGGPRFMVRRGESIPPCSTVNHCLTSSLSTRARLGVAAALPPHLLSLFLFVVGSPFLLFSVFLFLGIAVVDFLQVLVL